MEAKTRKAWSEDREIVVSNKCDPETPAFRGKFGSDMDVIEGTQRRLTCMRSLRAASSRTRKGDSSQNGAHVH